MESQIRIDRLKKLLGHMENGILSVGKFDFGLFFTKNHCGTAGCMAGELPYLFPEDWHMDYGVPKLIGSDNFTFGEDGMIFFGISQMEISNLFFPKSIFNYSLLTEDASREEVAENLANFIKSKLFKIKI